MDAFDDLMGGFDKPKQPSAPSRGQQGVTIAPAPSTSNNSHSPFAGLDFRATGTLPPVQSAPLGGLDFLSGGSTTAGAPPAAATGFSFMAAAGPTPALQPSMTAMAGSLDDALGSFGLNSVSAAPLPQLGGKGASAAASSGAAAAAPDFGSMSAGALKKWLDSKRVDHSACVEKSELVALARAAAGGAGGGHTITAAAAAASTYSNPAPFASPSSSAPPGPRPPHTAPPPSSSSSSSGGPRGALELGMPNAFELHGLVHAAPEAARRIEEQRAYDVKVSALGAPPPDLSSYFAAAKQLSVSQLVVPLLPPPKLAVRLPPAATDPVLREVPASQFYSAHTEASPSALSLSTSAAAAASAAGAAAAAKPGAVAMAPFSGHSLVGPLRYYEVALRPDASDAEVMNAIALAGREVGLDAVRSTRRSLLLQQRVTVPAAAFSAFAASAAVAGAASSARAPVTIRSSSAPDAPPFSAAASSSWLGGLLARSTLYVNSICVYLGVGPSGQRVAALLTGRFLPDAPAAAPSAGAPGGEGGDYHGRLVTKDKVGGAVTSTATDMRGAGKGGAATAVKSGPPSAASAAAAAAAASLMADLSGTAQGITVRLVERAPVPCHSYRADRHAPNGERGAVFGRGAVVGGRRGAARRTEARSAAATAAAAVAADDIFGFGAPSGSPGTAAAVYGGPGHGGDGDDAEGQPDYDEEEEEGVGSGAPKSPAQLAVAAERDIMAFPALPVPPAAAEAVGRLSALELVGRYTSKASFLPPDCDPCPLFNDGSRLLGDPEMGADGGSPGSGAADWSALRVSFMNVEEAGAPGLGGKRAAAPATSSPEPSSALLPQLSTAGSITSGAPFLLSQVEDELVSLTCELAAALRSHEVMAEAVWVDAVKAAKAALALERGEGGSTEVKGQMGAPATGAPPSAAVVAGAGSGTGDAPSFGGATATLEDALAMLDSGALSAAAPGPGTSSATAPLDQFSATAAALGAPPFPAPGGSGNRPLDENDNDASDPSSRYTSAPRFLVHPDASSAVQAAQRYAREPVLFRAAAPYETRARCDEATAGLVRRAAAPVAIGCRLRIEADPPVPRADAVPLEEEDVVFPLPLPPDSFLVYAEYTLPHVAPGSPAETAARTSASASIPSAPSGLTATDEVQREIYHRAYLVTRALGHAAAVLAQGSEAAVDVELAQRLARKRRSVALRCGAAFTAAVSLLSQMQGGLVPRGMPPASTATTAAGPAASVHPGVALLSTQFGVIREACLAHCAASYGRVSGELAVTAWRVVFYANVMGLHKTKRNIPIEAIVAVRPSAATLLGAESVTITFIDDEKVAASAAAKKTAGSKAAGSTGKGAPAAPVPPSKASLLDADADYFGTSSPASSFGSSLGAGGGVAGTGGDLFGGRVTAAVQPPRPAAAALTSVQGAFDELCAIDDGGAAAGAQPPAAHLGDIAPAAAAAASTGKKQPAAGPKPAATKQQAAASAADAATAAAAARLGLEGLSSDDLLVLVSGGGSIDTLSQMHISPVLATAAPSAPIPGAAQQTAHPSAPAPSSTSGLDKEMLLTLLRLLRQLHHKPHERSFGFQPTPLEAAHAAMASGGRGAGAAGLPIPDYAAWVAAHWGGVPGVGAAGTPLPPRFATPLLLLRPEVLAKPPPPASSTAAAPSGGAGGGGGSVLPSTAGKKGASAVGQTGAGSAVSGADDIFALFPIAELQRPQPDGAAAAQDVASTAAAASVSMPLQPAAAAAAGRAATSAGSRHHVREASDPSSASGEPLVAAAPAPRPAAGKPAASSSMFSSFSWSRSAAPAPTATASGGGGGITAGLPAPAGGTRAAGAVPAGAAAVDLGAAGQSGGTGAVEEEEDGGLLLADDAPTATGGDGAEGAAVASELELYNDLQGMGGLDDI